MKRTLSFLLTAGFLAGSLALTGCPPKKKMAIEERPKDEELAKDAKDAAADGADAPIEITQDWTEIPALSKVGFGYDSAALDNAARTALKQNVSILKKLPAEVTVRVEGHADQRGTVEYNIALGQRRANAIQTYYVTAGVPRNRVQTISFGEERPVCTEETESCYDRNRRGVTKVKSSQPLTIKVSELE